MDALKQAIAQIDPDQELRFFLQQDSQTLKAYLTITNVAGGNIAYKVKTTSPKYYVVKPNQGIIDKGQKITIDITMIQSSDNKIEDNKFLVQVANCALQSSETYQLQGFWDKLPKNISLSYKLKVSLASGQAMKKSSVQVIPEQPQSQEGSASFRGSQVEKQNDSYNVNSSDIYNQPQMAPSKNFQSSVPQQQQRHEYERAPDDDINNQSQNQSLSQSQVVVDRDQIKRKTEEVKAQLDQVNSQKMNLQAQISQIKNSFIENEKENYSWQQPDSKSEFKFQLIHLLITCIICLYIGSYLGARDPSTPEKVASL